MLLTLISGKRHNWTQREERMYVNILTGPGSYGEKFQRALATFPERSRQQLTDKIKSLKKSGKLQRTERYKPVAIIRSGGPSTVQPQRSSQLSSSLHPLCNLRHQFTVAL